MAEETPFIAPEIEGALETIEEDVVPESLPAEREARQQSCQAASRKTPSTCAGFFFRCKPLLEVLEVDILWPRW